MTAELATRDPIRVLFIEDNSEDVAIVRRLLSQYRRASFQVTSAATASQGLERLRGDGADLLLLDYSMPGEDGVTFLRRASLDLDLPPVIMLTGQGDERLVVDAMRSGAYDYFPKDALSPSALGGALQHAFEEFHNREERVRFDEQIMVALASAAESKDATTSGHLQRLARYALVLGGDLNLDQRQLQTLRYGALLHDIGKLAVRSAVLRKAAPLSDEEWDEIRQHPIVGERICSSLSCSRLVRPIIRHHHERWDGRGYVDGLAGEEIPLLARIVSIVDAYDAMVSSRPYREELSRTEALQQLQRGAGAQWDPDLVDVFIDIILAERLGPPLQPERRRPRDGRSEERHAA